jgi:hypothetical protein
MAADAELAAIRALYREFCALPATASVKDWSPAHRALIAKIRATVKARTAIRGDEMVLVADTHIQQKRW